VVKAVTRPGAAPRRSEIAAVYLTAAQLATRLSIGRRTVYTLPIPQHRFGGSVRWAESDILEYEKNCRFSSTNVTSGGGTNFVARLQVPQSALLAYFRRRGIEPKQKPLTAQRRRASSDLPRALSTKAL
jgi:predicted DNA-binding transcriptional regulator AlpA